MGLTAFEIISLHEFVMGKGADRNTATKWMEENTNNYNLETMFKLKMCREKANITDRFLNMLIKAEKNTL